MSDLDRLIARQRAVATQAAEVFMDEILGEAQRIAPLDEGTLSASADRETVQTLDGAEVTGSFSTVYARRQHEELTWRHRNGRRAKYLEAPFKAKVGQFPGVLARALKATL
jgi:hypothetical protein